ncbi:homeodomain-interacting protein kinase 2-like [Seriola aureovittata]|uniref:homeodomain-interacting protein kinase 2-like n=1 Tax=Seriola aureovittata TaxID=2871759 RepID=UPI0024BE6F1E|nr:homeodomain-interacting protein kinase 2-like [Seriola aureovittata]
MQSICEVLGRPADHLLDAGLKTRQFFIKTYDNQWTLKTHDQYWKNKISFGNKKFSYSSLDDLKTLSEEMAGEAEGWRQCVDLLKAMLQVDASKRISPREVLRHPFITQSYLNEALQTATDELSSSSSYQDLTDFRRTETVSETDDRTQTDQAQDSRGDGDVTSECLSDTLSCETLMLDPDQVQFTNSNEEIKTLIAEEPEDSTADKSNSRKNKKKKKKKNTTRRFFSWMNWTFSCCVSVEVEVLNKDGSLKKPT